jgi:hypothetical protein
LIGTGAIRIFQRTACRLKRFKPHAAPMNAASRR